MIMFIFKTRAERSTAPGEQSSLTRSLGHGPLLGVEHGYLDRFFVRSQKLREIVQMSKSAISREEK